MTEVRLTPAAKEDLESLGPAARQSAAEAISSLIADPEAGEPLHSPMTGSRWIGFESGRVIYKYDENADVCAVVLISMHQDAHRHLDEAAKRLAAMENPHAEALRALLDAVRPVLGN